MTKPKTLDKLPAGILPTGAVDCDLHHPNPTVEQLLPHLDDLWKDLIVSRGITQFDSIAYPAGSPMTVRKDWRPRAGEIETAERLVTNALDRFGTGIGILNNLCGVWMLYDAYMAAAVARAVNDWTRIEWLDHDPRLRASIVLPLQDMQACLREIERCATDRRFVQVLLPSSMHVPYGHRALWPIYATCERLELTVGIHAGSAYHHPVTSLGWPNTVSEDYAAQSQIVQSQLASLVAEGTFREHPRLRLVLLETGVSWLPAFLWRFQKFWKGLRFETPWVDRAPADIIREHVRLTAQPFDAPPDAAIVARLLEQIGSKGMLLYASDYPHWQFDGDDILPPGFDAEAVRRIAVTNPHDTYPRLGGRP